MARIDLGYHWRLGLLAVALLAGCRGGGGDGQPSQLVVLYRDSVAPGNSIVNLVNHNDPDGWKAMHSCEELRKLYESKDGKKYHCSVAVFDEYRPTIK